jgi:8-oxo-dGTP diphosphatase
MHNEPEKRPIVAIRVFAQDNNGRILLLKRDHTAHGQGRWCLPGGKLDYGDSPENTVAKEMKEETGLDVVDVKFLFYQNSLPVAPETMHCLNLYFSCTCGTGVMLNEESAEFAWVRPEEAPGYEPVFGAVEAIGRWEEAKDSG